MYSPEKGLKQCLFLVTGEVLRGLGQKVCLRFCERGEIWRVSGQEMEPCERQKEELNLCYTPESVQFYFILCRER